jgi:hypothetical protein
MSDDGWRAALRREILPVLCTIARGEGAAPAQRFRGEGFAAAICALDIATPAAVAAELCSLYAEVCGDAAAGYAAHEFLAADDAGVERPCLPVRLPRAPVFRGSAA